MVLNLANDYQLFDGVEDVTLQVRNASQAVVQSVEDVKALGRAVDYKALRDFSSLGLTSTDRVFHLWVATLGGVEVRERYTIEQADGTVWIVLAAVLGTMGTRYRCPCRLRK